VPKELEKADRPKPKSAEERVSQGIASARLRRYEEAAEEFREALKLNPSNAHAKRCLAMAERRLAEAEKRRAD
jgi:Flp pilus assembly protein TadD